MEYINTLLYFFINGLLLINFLYFFPLFFNIKKKFYLYVLVPIDFFFSSFLGIVIIYFYFFSFYDFIIIVQTSSSYQDLFYKFFVFWSTQEGSSLLWYIIFIFFNLILVFFCNLFLKIDITFFILFNVIKSFFYFYFYFFSNSFILSNFLFLEGYELNSILQNPLMSIHPPILYLGYLISILLFVFNIYIFLTFSFKKEYLFFINFLNVFSFILLLSGIYLGSFWAYNELGWGGAWSWDPIENVSFLPLLLLLISIHFFYIITDVKTLFLYFYLQFFYFILSIFGTFFLRSGLISSIHNFILDYSRGFILLLYYIILLISIFFIYFLVLYNNRNTLKYKLEIKPLNLLFLQQSIFCLLLFFFIIFWFTFFSFFFKFLKISDSFLFDTLFYNDICFFFFVFSVTFIISLFFFKLKFYKLNIFFICCTILLFYNIYIFFIFSCCMLCYSLIYGFSINLKNKHITFWVHWLFICLSLLILYSSFFSKLILIALEPGEFFNIFDLNILFYKVNLLENFYNSKLCIVSYHFIITNYDFTNILYEFTLDNQIVLNSNILRTKPEVISNLFYDLHFILSNCNNNNFNMVLKLIYKPFFFLIWLVTFLFIYLLAFSLFKRKYI